MSDEMDDRDIRDLGLYLLASSQDYVVMVYAMIEDTKISYGTLAEYKGGWILESYDMLSKEDQQKFVNELKRIGLDEPISHERSRQLIDLFNKYRLNPTENIEKWHNEGKIILEEDIGELKSRERGLQELKEFEKMEKND